MTAHHLFTRPFGGSLGGSDTRRLQGRILTYNTSIDAYLRKNVPLRVGKQHSTTSRSIFRQKKTFFMQLKKLTIKTDLNKDAQE